MSHGNALDPIAMELSMHSSSYKISSPYPNPFNPVVNIDLTLNGISHVDARVYDIRGREVAVINDGMMSTETLSWTATDYASGIYFLQIAIDGQNIQHKKIVLLK